MLDQNDNSVAPHDLYSTPLNNFPDKNSVASNGSVIPSHQLPVSSMQKSSIERASPSSETAMQLEL